MFVIRRETVAFKPQNQLADRGSPPSTIDDYKRMNQAQRQLSRNFSLRLPHVLFNKKDEATFRKNRWKWFDRRYPSSIYISLSDVGFDPEMKHAIVYLASTCGDYCGIGEMIFLEKHDVGWTISDRITEWLA
jgi:hypothetical protein